MNFNKLKPKISSLVSNSNVLDETLQAICNLLKFQVVRDLYIKVKSAYYNSQDNSKRF